MTAVAAMPMRLDTFGMSPPATPTSESSPSQIFRQHASGKGGSLEDLLKEEVKFEVMPGGLGSGGFEKYEKQLATPVQAKKREVLPTPLSAKPVTAAAASSAPDASPPTPVASSSSSNGAPILFDGILNQNWPAESRFKSPGRGLRNVGNTCFLNSVMQVMLHTPGLLRLAMAHVKTQCPQAKNGKWCLLCSFRAMVDWSFGDKHTSNIAYGPSVITNNLNKFAKHLRIGRQEDAQEFFRFATDAFQTSALAGLGKLPMSVQETTWIYALWGGKLLSRVSCMQCGANSDTYDSYLDLSIDVAGGVTSVRDGLDKFVAIDHLKGANKYKCEKCKKHVNAEKRFLLAEVPPVLTIHLKRFKPGGGKIARPIQYPSTLDISKYMVTKQSGVTYDLFGVTCHSGGGPHSGHYFSFIRAGDGSWHEMNDSDVSKCSLKTALSQQGAYLLSYVRSKGAALASAIQAPKASTSVNKPFVRENPVASSSKSTLPSPFSIDRPAHPSPGAVQKRKRELSEEAEEEEEQKHLHVQIPRVYGSPQKRKKDSHNRGKASFTGRHPEHKHSSNSRKHGPPNPFGFVGGVNKKSGVVRRMKPR